MTTEITGRWETIIKLIKFENKAKEVLADTLDEEPEFWNCVEVKKEKTN